MARAGIPGWDWASVEPHFRKVDAMAAPQRYTNPLSRAFLEACVETGTPRTGDFNGQSRMAPDPTLLSSAQGGDTVQPTRT